MRTAPQLRGLIRTMEAKIELYGLMLDLLEVDQIPRNFHAQCVLARQQLACFQAQLLDLTPLPAAALSAPMAPSGRLVTSQAMPQPASLHTT